LQNRPQLWPAAHKPRNPLYLHVRLEWWPSSPRGFAVATLAASEQLETDQLDNFVIVGELAPTG
jgi:hypothetical protein